MNKRATKYILNAHMNVEWRENNNNRTSVNQFCVKFPREMQSDNSAPSLSLSGERQSFCVERGKTSLVCCVNCNCS